jgi:hypothetical protein
VRPHPAAGGLSHILLDSTTPRQTSVTTRRPRPACRPGHGQSNSPFYAAARLRAYTRAACILYALTDRRAVIYEGEVASRIFTDHDPGVVWCDARGDGAGDLESGTEPTPLQGEHRRVGPLDIEDVRYVEAPVRKTPLA